ncbi:hypothetical protein [Rufibacter roseus]|uniref:Long-chain fatty acid transport protein n=1 Tax=Rufibacter roseus TaxID=1567108 RepID=A0ABW2DIR1_9BACT|nr:hypothetical protein [Rufibacter roseus]
MYKPFRALLLLSSLFVGTQVQAQQLSNSPYSRFGVGEMFHGTGSIRNAGMGQVGVAAFNVSGTLFNDINPALSYYNPAVTFEAAVNSELKKLSDGQNSQLDGTANLGYLTLAIPVARRWHSVIGLRPYSRVNYTTFLNSPVEGAPSVTTYTEYKGEGGLNEVFFTNSFFLFKGFTAGLTSSYVFGTIDRDASTVLVDANDTNAALQKTLVHTTTKYNGFLFKGGLHYRNKIKDGVYLGVGGTYTAQTVLDADRMVSQERRYLDDALISRTVTDSTNGFTSLPQSFQVGIGIDNARNWSAGIDYTANQNSSFHGFSARKNEGTQEMGDGYRIGVGTEFTPDPGSVTSYLKRVNYRLGGYYSKAEMLASGGTHNLTNMAITAGMSFPVGRGVRPPDYTQALLSTSFTVGIQESKESGLKEEFFRVNLGVTFNNRWFIKRRFD